MSTELAHLPRLVPLDVAASQLRVEPALVTHWVTCGLLRAYRFEDAVLVTEPDIVQFAGVHPYLRRQPR